MGVGAHAAERLPTEADYFAQVPVVLTASRLDQPLNEAPGAMTVIDRDTIRQSGARTVAEVLRLVPGYVLGGWNGANPLASYHVALDDFGGRNLVLIDGRSVYASSYLGDTHYGMMGVLLPDIERIEVLRGANSAAYGANAMFGVVNIITRHSADTVGGSAALSVGDNGIRDTYARLGVGNEARNVRVSVGEQRDRGYLNAFDDKRLGQVHVRADLQPSLADDVMVSLGVSELLAGEGYSATDKDNPFHQLRSRTSHAQVEWRRQLDDRNALQVSVDYMEDRRWEPLTIRPIPSVSLDVDSGTWGQRQNVEVQQRTVWSPAWRTLVGVHVLGALRCGPEMAATARHSQCRCAQPGAVLVGSGVAGAGACGQAQVFTVSGAAFRANPALGHEVFGPSSIIVVCADLDEVAAILAGMEGQLTATLHMAAADYPAARDLIPILENRAGRIIANAWPTGVEVTHAMVHGGPFPATSDGRSTSVGTLAIDRFLRPVSYQDLPAALLPKALLDGPSAVLRRVDGAWQA